jgi:spore germination cell wall hydrolase CwlJ-like protein
LPDLTDGSLWYHASYVLPKWSRVKKKTMTIDTHIFYR